MITICGDAYWINGKNEINNRSIYNIVREVLIDSNQLTNKWSCEAETSATVHRCKIHSALDNTSHHFAWYGKNTSIHELRKFGC